MTSKDQKCHDLYHQGSNWSVTWHLSIEKYLSQSKVLISILIEKIVWRRMNLFVLDFDGLLGPKLSFSGLRKYFKCLLLSE